MAQTTTATIRANFNKQCCSTHNEYRYYLLSSSNSSGFSHDNKDTNTCYHNQCHDDGIAVAMAAFMAALSTLGYGTHSTAHDDCHIHPHNAGNRNTTDSLLMAYIGGLYRNFSMQAMAIRLECRSQ
eukprot:scaffold235088_cov19-Prasinocladus_malaysianus.AAC.1